MTKPEPTRTLRQRLLYVARMTLFILVVLALVIPTLTGALFMMTLTSSMCGGETIPPMPHENVAFASSEFARQTPAYFIPAAQPNGATVIVLPTGSARRGGRMSEIAVYHEAGFAVLSYSSRVCVGGVANTLGYREAEQVGDALSYLASRNDIDMDRVGAHGFSAGGAAAIMAAAQFPALRAVVAQGGYHNFADEVAKNTSPVFPFGALFRFGAHLSYRARTGLDIHVLSPVDAIALIAPRPVLLVYGTNEPGLDGARLQLAAAGSNAQLWEVPGAGHGDYLHAAPDEYRLRLPAFMAVALSGA